MLRKRLRSFKYAFQGFGEMVRSQPNARIHLLAAVIVLAAGVILNISPLEWALLAFAIGAVLSAEAFNTALEHLTDLASPDKHPLAGKAKDAAAAAVLLAAFTAVVIGLIIFIPKLGDLLANW